MEEIQINFVYKEKVHEYTFTPEEEDWWYSFESEGIVFDIHYCVDYNSISIYEIENNKRIETGVTIIISYK